MMGSVKTIELYSELEQDKKYTLEGQEYTYAGKRENDFVFVDAQGSESVYSMQDLQQLIDAGDVKSVGNPEIEETLSNFPKLDRFTRNTFGVPTHTLLELGNINDTDLYTLEELIERHHLTEMPLPGEGKYDKLLADEHWQTLKRYLTAISPDIDLPEELG